MKLKLFGSLEGYLYTALASVVMVWASHHPVWHDPSLWLLGVIGHAIGTSSGKPGAGAAPEVANGAVASA